jgi:hypothetical protein
LDIHNAHPNGVIGLTTTDTNVDHTRWPCVSHPPTTPCEDAVRTANRKGFKTLTPAPTQIPQREWGGR